jgi:GNAT superfamily N-acetyltransferase
MDLFFEPLVSRHDRAAFSCGEDSVDRFLRETALKRAEAQAATTIVAVCEPNSSAIVGFYTLIPHEFRGEELPTAFRRQVRIGSLTAVPGVLLAQLGLARPYHGKGIGVALLQHALRRCSRLASEYGAVAVVTDPANDRAEQFYASFDFEPLNSPGKRLILPMKKLVLALEKQDRLRALARLAATTDGLNAGDWLRTPQPKLGGRSPEECCDTDRDFDRAAALLNPPAGIERAPHS